MCPDIVMTKTQMRTLIDETLQHFPHLEEENLKKIRQKYPPSSENLPKIKLYVSINDNVSRQAINSFKNDLMNHINDESVYIFDSHSFAEDIKNKMIIL